MEKSGIASSEHSLADSDSELIGRHCVCANPDWLIVFAL